MSASLPAGLPLQLDHAATLRGALLIGGDPPRLLRLSAGGQAALARLLTDGAVTATERQLARRLLDTGLAHPRAATTTDGTATLDDLTIAIPVRDRAAALDRCLKACSRDRVAIVVVDDGSVDADAIAAVCSRHDARLLRHTRPSGPAAARNTALAAVATPLAALLDSDCQPAPGWLHILRRCLDDPAVVAAAPRIVRAGSGSGSLARYATCSCPLDMGAYPARVIPGGRVAYVPTAALLVRTAAARTHGFDPDLRYGEDVDLIWRLHDDHGQIRYEPQATVMHHEPAEIKALLTRGFHYGTSAAPLAARHDRRLAPLVLALWPSTICALMLANRPHIAATACTYAACRLTRSGLPPTIALRHLTAASVHTLAQASTAATMLAAPALACALIGKRRRRIAAILTLAGPLRDWWPRRHALDPLRFTALQLTYNVAYGTGVWVGALRARNARALLPRRQSR